MSDSEKQVADSKRIYRELQEIKLAPYQNAYRQVVLKRNKNPLLAMKADSLMQTTSKIADLIDSLIIVIKNIDPMGARLDIGRDLIVNSPVGTRLKESVNSIYQLSLRSLTDEEKIKEAKMYLSKYKGYLSTGEFMDIYFSKSSTSFILMTLYGLKIDMIHVAFLALADIDSQMSG